MIDRDNAGPLVELATELQRQLDTKRDLVADTQRVSFLVNEADTGTGLTLGVDMPDGLEEFTVMPHAHGQIAQHLGIDRRFYDRLLHGVDTERGSRKKKRKAHPDLLAGLANGLLSRESSKRMLRVMDGNVRAFLSNAYRPRDNWDLLEQAVLPVLNEHPGNVVIQKCDLTDTRMYVKILLPEFELSVTPQKGDIIHGGLIVQNSEVGAGSLGVYPFTSRLICLNGMVHTDYGQGQRHVGKRIESTEEAWEMYSDNTLKLDDEAFFAKCQDTVRGVLTETVFDAIVQQMRDLADIRVQGAPDHVVEVFAKNYNLRDTERGSMLEALIEGGDLSAWGYMNAFTQTARDLDDADRQVDLQKLAGELTADPSWALVAA